MREIKFDDLKFATKRLGKGGQGEVWTGHWCSKLVAIRKIEFSEGCFDKISREVDILKLLRHPNIVMTMGYCNYQYTMYIVMELVQGFSLHSVLFNPETSDLYKLTPTIRDKIVIQLSQAVTYIHHGVTVVIHRDIKPLNIVITNDLTAKLCDFGMSKLYKNCATVTGYSTMGKSRCRTYPYMAPEIINCIDTKPTKASDIWTVGCTIVETYNNEPLFPNQCEEVIKKQKEEKFREEKNFQKIPETIRSTVQKSFSADPTETPPAQTICDYCDLENDCWKTQEQIRQDAIDRFLFE